VNDDIPNDESLVGSARNGSPDAFAVLAGRYRAALTRYAYRYLRDREDANDVAQEALYRAYRSLWRVERGRSFKNWLFVIARNVAYDTLRSRERMALRAVPDDFIPTHEPGPEEFALRDDTRHSVRRALRALPCRYREPLELYYVSGLLYREIADVLDLPIGTVKTNIARAKRRLRSALENVPLQRIA
jgi:RNA polymerase sigma-70 factor (ECF subfamily)